MIHTLSSTDPRFQELSFGPALNILVAEQHEHATDADTRNGVGKSSLVSLLHFLLGANAGTNSIFKSDALSDSVFTLDFDLGVLRRSVSRSGAKPSRFSVSQDPSEPSDQLFTNGLQMEILTLTEWKDLLRKNMFGLAGHGGPSARSLLSYFARRVEDGGFDNPFKHNPRQATDDFQVAISFLLDLDWHIPESWSVVRKREKNVRVLSKALESGELGSIVTGSVAQLRTEVALAASRVNNLRKNIDNFQVVEAFTKLEAEANELTAAIRRLSDENTIDMALIDQLRLTYKSEVPPDADDLTAMYESAGVQLGNLVRKRFHEVAEFHESVIQNRARHLQEEIIRAEERVSKRNDQRQSLDSRRADLLRILRSGGALSELTGLQEELAIAQANLEELRISYQTADEIATGKAGVKKERQILLVELQADQREREDQLRHLIGQFEWFSSRLYEEREGSLEIGSSENGPTFDIVSEAGKSKGISNMQVFCFDLLVSQICAERGIGPGFLVHDSHIFDGVDERQVGRGLALANKVANTSGFQYIVTMNSDDIPETLPDGFSIEDHVMDVRLTDTVPEGGLFGFRF